MYMIFVNLLVQDLIRAREFYESLGFRADQHSSDERSAALIVDDKIVISLVTRDAFAELVDGEVGELSSGPTTVNCLSVGSRDEVDTMVAKAAASGGRTWFEDGDGATHTGSFADPDGHLWRVTWMEPMHVID